MGALHKVLLNLMAGSVLYTAVVLWERSGIRSNTTEWIPFAIILSDYSEFRISLAAMDDRVRCGSHDHIIARSLSDAVLSLEYDPGRCCGFADAPREV